MSNVIERAHYLLSAHLPNQLPPDDGREVVFVGRSNAGKSTALNALTKQKALARVSKTPGRTRQLVYFHVLPQRYLVDLPGYGYARVSRDLQAHWQAFIDAYFATRQSLQGLVVVMDCRHPLTPDDWLLLDYATQQTLPFHVVLTKADKLGRGQQNQALKQVQHALQQRLGAQASVQLFSGAKRQGVEQLQQVVCGWLALTTEGAAAEG